MAAQRGFFDADECDQHHRRRVRRHDVLLELGEVRRSQSPAMPLS